MNPITVSEINSYIKAYLDGNPMLNNLFVRGEISNFKHHSSGHLYMSLKDENSVIKAVMFKYSAMSLQFEPENGMKVIVNARLSSYERDGIYQLYINEMIPDGTGSLHIKFEQLKEKLSKEGLFDSKFKKAIPQFPEKIGVVTSATGAAIKDILNILKRRYPLCEVIVYPARVQGEGAHKTIIDGILYFEKIKTDTIIIGRGGGSQEDLWCFNEEELARVIFSCTIPLISAVGHETDYTISDLVADLRAPTPSAAAELAVPSKEELKKYLFEAKKRLQAGIKGNFEKQKQKFELLKGARVFRSPMTIIETRSLELTALSDKLLSRYEKILSSKRESFEKLAAGLDALSPLKILKRGYAFVENENDEIADSITKIEEKGNLYLNFSDGRAVCKVTEIKGGKNGKI